MQPRAVIFDMDGVLLDSEPLHFAAIREVLGEDGVEFTEAQNEEFLGWAFVPFFAEMKSRFGLPGPVEHYLERYDSAILSRLGARIEPADGVRSLLDELTEREIPLAVASSSQRSWILLTIRSLGIADAFREVVSGDDVARGKPAPDIYQLAAERLGYLPGECVAVEDSANGVASAHAAGMEVIGVRTRYTAHLRLDGATVVVDSLAQLGAARSLLGLNDPPKASG